MQHATDSDVELALPVQGMTCAACATRLERVLGKVSGVREAVVSLPAEQARVRVARGTSPVAITDAIEKAGFHVTPDVVRLSIGGMTCATCAQRIEKVLRRQSGVISAEVNLAAELAIVTIVPTAVNTSQLIAAIERAGYTADVAHVDAQAQQEREQLEEKRARREMNLVVAAVALTVPLVAPMLVSPLGLNWMLPAWVQLVLATPVQFVAGARFYRGAFGALRAGSGNMDVLVSLGTSAAYGLSLYVMFVMGTGHLYFEASAAVITLVLLGKWLESRAKRKTTDAIRALAELRPETARVHRDGSELEIPVDAVRVGDIVIVRPGERVPVDGTIRTGTSQLDESLITGESLPVERGPEEPVTGGSINGEGLLRIEATHLGADSVLARIIAMVESAQASKAPIQRLVDRVAAVFVPVVVAVATVVLVGWLASGTDLETAVIYAVAVLVIACPCALGLATPAALTVGTGAAARAGILIKDAEALERAHDIQLVVFDKTGTLTEGRPVVREIVLAQGSQNKLLSLAASAQQGSEHPLGKALIREAAKRKLKLTPVDEFRAIAGKGLEALVDETRIAIGSRRLMEDYSVVTGALEKQVVGMEQQGMTVMWVAELEPASLIGVVGVGDKVRDSARQAVAELKSVGVEVVMLTGDNKRTAQVVADELGIERVIAEVLPQDKAEQVNALRSKGRVVAMVGDGVNDAPALAAADVSIAMGSGTDVAMHTAMVTLMRSEPTLVFDTISVSRATTGKIKQNLFWAFFYNVIGIPLAGLGYLSPVIAGAAMAMSSVSVITNALTLKRWRPTR